MVLLALFYFFANECFTAYWIRVFLVPPGPGSGPARPAQRVRKGWLGPPGPWGNQIILSGSQIILPGRMIHPALDNSLGEKIS